MNAIIYKNLMFERDLIAPYWDRQNYSINGLELLVSHRVKNKSWLISHNKQNSIPVVLRFKNKSMHLKYLEEVLQNRVMIFIEGKISFKKVTKSNNRERKDW